MSTTTSKPTATTTTQTKPTATTPITVFTANPLPTNYKVSSDCSGIYKSGNAGVFMVDDKLSCLPDRFNPATDAFYSPGVLCPTGYTAPPSCSRNDGVRSITTVTCCPVRGEFTMSCVDDAATLKGTFSNLFCTWIAGPQTVVLATVTDAAGKVATTGVTMAGKEGFNAYGVRMVYQSTDMAALSTTLDGGSPTNSPVTPPTNSAGLSTGAIAAIAIVIPVVLLAIIGAAFVWRRKRKASADTGSIGSLHLGKAHSPPPPSVQQQYSYNSPQYSHVSPYYSKVSSYQPITSSPSPGQTEVDGAERFPTPFQTSPPHDHAPAELPGHLAPVELPARM